MAAQRLYQLNSKYKCTHRMVSFCSIPDLEVMFIIHVINYWSPFCLSSSVPSIHPSSSMRNQIPRDPIFLMKSASVASSTKPLTDRILPHGLCNWQQTIGSWAELKQVGRTGVPVTTASLRSAGAGRATKVASSPNSAPPPDGKRRTPARRRTGSCGGGGGRSPGSESRSACVEASTSGFLRCGLSTMAAWLLLLLGWPVAAATGARWRERERERGA